MEAALLGGRLLLAAVFAVAGLAKLGDRSGSRRAVVGFGVPERLAAPLAVALPLAELAVAVALVPKVTAWWGAVAALALLTVFIGAIAANLALGRRPDCHCFGQLHSSPAGWRTLARNAALAAVAGFVVWQAYDDPGASAVAWLGELSATQLVGVTAGTLLALAVVAEGALLLNLMRQNGRLLLRIEALERGAAPAGEEGAAEEAEEQLAGLPVGSAAPGFTLRGLYGEILTLDYLRSAGYPVLLLFTDPNCSPCNALMPEIGTWQREHADRITIALVSRGDPDANRAKTSEHGLTNVVLQEGLEVLHAYGGSATPSAVVVRADGTIGSGLVGGADAIRALVSQTVGTAAQPAPAPPAPVAPAAPAPPAPAPPPAVAEASANGSGDGAETPSPQRAVPRIGDPAPTVKLPDLKRRTVNLAGFRGSETAVLFWNPGCGFCSQMLDDLKAWEANRPDDAPKLFVVSTGSVEANNEMGLRSPVVLDQGFSVGTAFGATGTPSAVLVDAEGRIASELAVGGPAVLSLLGANSGDGRPAAPPPVARRGDSASGFELPDLEARTVRLADYRGKDTLLVFWNPGCGFCSQMVDDLNAWETERPPDAPEVLLVSTGTVEANRELGLTSRIVLDQSFAVATSFGANGTPMAVLVDADGKVASELAAGGPAVLALAKAGRQAQPASA